MGTCELSNKRDCEVCCSSLLVVMSCGSTRMVNGRQKTIKDMILGPSATESLIVS